MNEKHMNKEERQVTITVTIAATIDVEKLAISDLGNYFISKHTEEEWAPLFGLIDVDNDVVLTSEEEMAAQGLCAFDYINTEIAVDGS